MHRLTLNSLIQTSPTTNSPETSRSSTPTGTASFWKTWYWWLPPAIVGLGLVLYFVDPFIGDWDGLDYTMLSLSGYPSSMALGRNLFIFTNHWLFQVAHALFGVQPEHAYLIFKYAVVAQAPFTVIACWILARDVSSSLYVATISALLIVFSPVFVVYGGQVMTDVPSVLVLAAALVVHLRGLRQKKVWLVLLGAALLGLGVNLRETVGFFAPWLVLAPFVLGWKFQRRDVLWVMASCVVFVFVAFGWFGYWFLTDPHYRWVWDGWRESMRKESARHPITLANLNPYLTFFFVSAPLIFLTLPIVPFLEWKKRGLSAMLLLWLVGLFSNLLLFFNYSTIVNWRYFLTGLPALVPLGAWWMLHFAKGEPENERRGFFVLAFGIVLIAVLFFIYMRPISYEFIERRAMSKEYRRTLEAVPLDAVMISGAQTIAVHYWASIGSGRWKTIGTGGGWPGDDLIPIIQNHLDHRRRVFIDTDPLWWQVCGWQRDEIPFIVDLENHFSFRHVKDTIYELSWRGDPNATDNANLSRLLPENRPEDMRLCPPVRR